MAEVTELPPARRRGHKVAEEVRAAKLHRNITARAASAEAVAAAAAARREPRAPGGKGQAAARAAGGPNASIRHQTLLDSGAANLLDEDAENGIRAYSALEALDAAVSTWAMHANVSGNARPTGKRP